MKKKRRKEKESKKKQKLPQSLFLAQVKLSFLGEELWKNAVFFKLQVSLLLELYLELIWKLQSTVLEAKEIVTHKLS